VVNACLRMELMAGEVEPAFLMQESPRSPSLSNSLPQQQNFWHQFGGQLEYEAH